MVTWLAVLNRRRFLHVSAGLPLGCTIATAKAAPSTPKPDRIAVLDWTLAEMALQLGLNTVALTETDGYHQWVGLPKLPASTVEIGLRSTPNLEMLIQVKPDLILLNEGQAGAIPALALIAPCISAAIYTSNGQPYVKAQSELRRLGALFGRSEAAEIAINLAEAAIVRGRATMRGYARPVYLARFIDERNVMVFGRNSLFQDVLDRMGVINAWTGKTNPWGYAIVGIDRLASANEAHLLYLGLSDTDLIQVEAKSAVWRNLPFVRHNRISVLPGMWFFGAVASAEKFAHGVVAALPSGGVP